VTRRERHWTETFFTETYRRIELESKWESAPREAQAVKRALRLRRGDRVLDLCCGIGRHSIALARLGLEVTGFDLNEGYLRRARREAGRQKVKARFLRGDMREPAFASEFHAVINIFTSFGYYDDGTNQEVLERIARALRPGGKFLIETMNRNGLMKNYRTWEVSAIGRDLVVRRHEFDPLTARMKSSWRVVRGNRVLDLGGFDLRIYAPNELAAMIERAGLTVASASGGLDLSPLLPDSRRQLLIAHKPKR